MSGPLAGIKVIDVSEVISGPLAAMILADQGADVIKVEPPSYGEESRMLVNYRQGMAAMYANCNHGKRSIGLNLKDPEGLAVLHDLVRDADVFVTNWRPGAAERLRVDEASLREVNPQIIYASITGYGPDGPYASRRGYDPIFQALTGFVAAQVNPEAPSPSPDLVRNAIVDKATSYSLAQGVTAALFSRERGGPPQHVQVAMIDAGLAFFWPDGMMGHSLIGDQQNTVIPGERYQLSNTADGQLTMFTATSDQMRAALRAVGQANLADDPSQRGRKMLEDENVAARAVAMREGLATMTTADAYDALIAAEIPVAPVLSHSQIFEDPQVVHNGAVLEGDHDAYGRFRRAHPSARFSETPFDESAPPALYGEHTDEILTQHGYDTERIVALRQSGAAS